MTIKEILAAWERICKEADIRWYLYRETLLCAHCFDTFPAMLNTAQVAVLGKDLPKLLETGFPALPHAWSTDWEAFLKLGIFRFAQEGVPLLEVHVLCETVDSNAEQKLLETARSGEVRYKRWNAYAGRLGGVLGKPFAAMGKRCAKKHLAQFKKTLRQADGNADFYSEGMRHDRIPKQWLAQQQIVCCGETAYPVFSGYREYLEETYGDYENGLFDEIGCGLTVEDKEALKAHQQRCKEALAFIQQLSQEFGLRYYLLAGSVLGPVRHGGFIPWDDDIDIGIHIEELEQFEALVEEYLPQRLPEGFSLKKPGVDKREYPRMFSKICYDGRCCMDLWPLVPTYAEGFRAKVLWGIGKVITKVHYKKIGYKVTRFKKIVKLVDPFLSDKLVMWIARRNERRYANRPTDAYINLYSIYRRRKETILRTWLDTPATLDFDGLQVPVVGCTEEYLTHLYGDYMWKPAPWNRASRHVERF